MAEHVKNGHAVAGVSRSGDKYVVEMKVRVTVTASSHEEAIERSVNTINWLEWQWLGERLAGRKPE